MGDLPLSGKKQRRSGLGDRRRREEGVGREEVGKTKVRMQNKWINLINNVFKIG